MPSKFGLAPRSQTQSLLTGKHPERHDEIWTRVDELGVSVKDDGATGVGTADDGAAIAATNARPGVTVLLPSGTYRVASNRTFSSPLIFQKGAVLKPDAGVTITLTGAVIAGPHRIFDLSAGGSVAPARTFAPFGFLAQWWGATGLGVVDDTATCQAMLNALPASSRWAVVGTFLINTYSDPGNGQRPFLIVKQDDITIEGVSRSDGFVSTTAEAPGATVLIWAAGMAKIGTIGDLGTWYPSRPGVNITAPIAKGSRTVNVASGASFTAGDYVYLRTGQTVGVANNMQPDSELHVVGLVSGNVLSLHHPTAKPYAQEYFVSGTSGLTTTSVTANAAKFQVHKVTDCTIRKFTMRNLTIDAPNTTWWSLAMQVHDVTFEDLRGRFGHACIGVQYVRRAVMRGIKARKWRADVAGAALVGAATGANDVVIDDCEADGQPSMLHSHEGVGGLRASKVVIRSAAFADAGGTGLSIASRAYDHVITDSEFSGGTNPGVLLVSADCIDGGVISNCTFINNLSGATLAGSVQGLRWQIHHNRSNLDLGIDGSKNTAWNNPLFGATPGNSSRSPFSPGRVGPTLAAGSTPSVAVSNMRGDWFLSTPAAATNLNNLLGAADGQQVMLLFLNANTTVRDVATGGRFRLTGTVSWNPTPNSTLTVRYYAATDIWYEVARSAH